MLRCIPRLGPLGRKCSAACTSLGRDARKAHTRIDTHTHTLGKRWSFSGIKWNPPVSPSLSSIERERWGDQQLTWVQMQAVPCLRKAAAEALTLQPGKPGRLFLMRDLWNLTLESAEGNCSSSETTHHSTPQSLWVAFLINCTSNENCFKKPDPECSEYLQLEYHGSEQSLALCFVCCILH